MGLADFFKNDDKVSSVDDLKRKIAEFEEKGISVECISIEGMEGNGGTRFPSVLKADTDSEDFYIRYALQLSNGTSREYHELKFRIADNLIMVSSVQAPIRPKIGHTIGQTATYLLMDRVNKAYTELKDLAHVDILNKSYQ